MTLGKKIKKLRNEKGLTQKDLAEQVHVTFQTVSKWEKDENEPDVSTLRELCKLFNCSMDYLLSEEDNQQTEEEIKEEQPIQQTIVIHKNELHVCTRCGKEIPEDDLVVKQLYRTVRSGRTSHRVAAGQAYYHTGCYQELVAEEDARKEKQIVEKAKRSKKVCFGWGIAGGVVALGIALAVFLGVPQCREVINPVASVFLSIFISYAIFADIYCILSGSYIGEVFSNVSSWSIKFPGVIFSFDLGGFAWLIAVKILFAILGFLFGVFVLALAITLSAVLAAISFPFILVKNISNRYEDAL